MTTARPPTLSPQAAARWAQMPVAAPLHSPWLHEEVARRMEERLQWIVHKPTQWVHWQPLQGGLQAHALLARRYPDATCFVMQAPEASARLALKAMVKPWWNPSRWRSGSVRGGAPTQAVQMLWANMALHMAADPQALMAHWHRLLAVDGFLMFSCLGPDTLRELRRVYGEQGWGPFAHALTDMHDWGDMLVHAGFAEPVMDMERITLSYSTPHNLLAELRELGRNLHVNRFPALRGRGWRDRLHAALQANLARQQGDGRLEVTFEVIYGHAFKPVPRVAVKPETTLSVDALRDVLRQGHKPNTKPIS